MEYKQDVTSSTFMKTISAFANYEGGEIIFGITDDGKIVGVENPETECLNLENKINNNINPVPDYALEIEHNKTIHLTVYPGIYKPYLYKGKAYKRNDTATVEVGRMEYNRLILAGRDQSYEELPSIRQNFTFCKLEQELIRIMNINNLNKDILKTLELYSDKNGFNNAAALLADENDFVGTDIIRFGDSIDEIMERKTVENISILSQMEESVEMFRRYYQYEKIDGSERSTVDKIPEKAFREATANALVHRNWDIKSSIKISMFADKIEISSPGGLPEGIEEEDYINGQISLLRNPIIANVFFRLKYIEKFGTGILRINNAYKNSLLKPDYKVYPNSTQVILPTLTNNIDLRNDEKLVLDLLKNNNKMSRAEITNSTGLEKDKLIRILNHLLEKKVIKREGAGRGVTYSSC